MRREIIIAPSKPDERIFERVVARGIKAVYMDPERIPERFRGKVEVYHESELADWRIVRDSSSVSEKSVPEIALRRPEDYEKIVAAARMGARSIIVWAEDLKIIALENLIADLAPLGARIIAAASPHEVETLSGVLEKGVDTLLVPVNSPDEVDLVVDQVSAPSGLELGEAEVVEVRDVGLGERACIDTTSMLGTGEGMLVGSTSSLLALIHNENPGSALTSPRPFRVNAGAIHSYTLAPDGSTRYLSELRAGDRVLIVSKKGARVVSIGRVKIERRPLRLIRIRMGDIEGSVIIQSAETIMLLAPDEALIPATEIKPGDTILAHTPKGKARHFGRAVDEFIIER
jgi:3-dehydroquinate synthase II